MRKYYRLNTGRLRETGIEYEGIYLAANECGDLELVLTGKQVSLIATTRVQMAFPIYQRMGTPTGTLAVGLEELSETEFKWNLKHPKVN